MREAKASEEGNDPELDEDYIKVRLYFFTPDKQINKKLFTEEWFFVAADQLDDSDELKITGIPFLEVSAHNIYFFNRETIFIHALSLVN